VIPTKTLSSLIILTLGIAGCSSVPQVVQDRAKAECASIASSWERAKCVGAKKREWEREQEVEAAIKDCKRYWPDDKKMEIARCVDRRVNPPSSGSANSAAALAICTALTGGNAGSCAAGVAEGSSDTRKDKASERVRELERELQRRQQKFSQDCLLSGGIAVGESCMNPIK